MTNHSSTPSLYQISPSIDPVIIENQPFANKIKEASSQSIHHIDEMIQELTQKREREKHPTTFDKHVRVLTQGVQTLSQALTIDGSPISKKCRNFLIFSSYVVGTVLLSAFFISAAAYNPVILCILIPAIANALVCPIAGTAIHLILAGLNKIVSTGANLVKINGLILFKSEIWREIHSRDNLAIGETEDQLKSLKMRLESFQRDSFLKHYLKEKPQKYADVLRLIFPLKAIYHPGDTSYDAEANKRIVDWNQATYEKALKLESDEETKKAQKFHIMNSTNLIEDIFTNVLMGYL